MLQRPCLLSMIMAALCTSAALPDEYEARPNEVPGWGRVIDPWQDCDVSLDHENERLTIQLPGTPHVLSAEVPQLPMNAPLVVRRVRGDFTANVHVLGRLVPGPFETTHYDPYHGAGLIVWQDPSKMLNVEGPQGSMARDYADRDTEGPPPSPPASRDGPQGRPRRASVLFDSAPKRKSLIRDSAPIKIERTGFQW